MGELIIKVAQIPKPFKDVDELLQSEGGDVAYQAMIADAAPSVSWMIAHLEDVRGHDLTTAKGAVDAAEDMVDVLLRQHPIARMRYARELAEVLGESIDAVWEMLQDTLTLREAYWTAHPHERPKLPRRQPRRFPGFTSADPYGETGYFDCPACGSEDGAKANKPLDLWHCVICDASGKASWLRAGVNALDAAVIDV